MTFSEEVAEYAKIDSMEEDVQGFIDSAEMYLTNAGITADETNAIYKLAVKMLVTFWHDNRTPSGSTDAQPFGLAGLISQLKYCVIADETVTAV